MATTPSYLSGRVNAVVYENGTNAFYILKMVLDSTDSSAPAQMVTAKGNIPGLQIEVGTWFGFEGKWVTDATYGRQLNITRAPVLKGDWDADTALKMLAANGVSLLVAQSIWGHFGDEGFIDALENVDSLMDVPGITKFAAMHVSSRWLSVKAHFKGLEFLSSLGLPSGVVQNIWSHFGEDARDVLATNPWALVEVDGITFAQADEVARKSGLTDPVAQVRGAVLFACKANKTFGHLFLRTGNIFQVAQASLPDITQEQVVAALGSLSKDGLVIIDRKTRPGTAAVYEPWVYETEKVSAQHLLQRDQLARFLPGDERTVTYLKALGSVGPQTLAAGATGTSETRLGRAGRAAIEEWGDQAHLVLSEPQKDGIFYALTAPVSILSGLPGTGKTTSLRAAVRILQDAGVPFLLCAPTGIAAKNLASRTGAPASTIHRAFSAKGTSERRGSTYAGVTGDAAKVTSSGPGDSEWGYSQANPHPAEVVIIDEASMLDQHLLYRLLDCTKPTARLVFVGDHAQLPSVGPGNVLRDLITSDAFPTVKLTQIFRQADTSGIVFAAHSIHAGDVPELNKDFRLLAMQSEDDVLDAVLKIGVRFKEEHKNFQILSPKHNGTVGVTNLNARLRELINPAAPGLAEYRIGSDTIREGDRIMVIQNEYKLGVFNGDVGKVAKVDRGKKQVEIMVYGDRPSYVMLEFKDVARLIRLAYACTVHKAQGLEYDTIVMPIVTGFYHQLQRNLLYTAITRAKKQVILIGHTEALAKAVFNAKEDERATLFLDRLLGGILPAPSA